MQFEEPWPTGQQRIERNPSLEIKALCWSGLFLNFRMGGGAEAAASQFRRNSGSQDSSLSSRQKERGRWGNPLLVFARCRGRGSVSEESQAVTSVVRATFMDGSIR
jgi:hypothetical protein